jgi:hypothetical protein
MKKALLTALLLLFAGVFLVSVLTVESHANEKGGLAAKAPTIIETTIELAVDAACENALQVFTAIDYLPVPQEMRFVNKASVFSFVYRGPPSVVL